MQPDRRSILKGVSGVFMGGVAFSGLSTATTARTNQQRNSSSDGISLAVNISENQQFQGLSAAISVERVADPGGDEQDDDGEVLHITSLADGEEGDESDSAAVFDYGVSVVDLQDRDLTVEDLTTYEDDESDGGFVYDWWVTDEDVVGVDTDHEQSSVGPDEAWLILKDPDAKESGNGRGSGIGRLMSGQILPVFRTMYADEETGEWHTRMVSDEFEENEGPSWRALSVDERAFVDIDSSLVEAYGDSRVVGVGVGRGDPFWGPSILDMYYRNLQVAGETYAFPVPSNGSGLGGQGNGNQEQGNEGS